VGIRLASVYDSATTVWLRTFTSYITVTVPASHVPVPDIFGTVTFH
jgi:hypothetical protein